MSYQHFHYVFSEYTQNNLKYLILNMIHLPILSHHPCWSRYFEFIVIASTFYVFPCIVNIKI